MKRILISLMLASVAFAAGKTWPLESWALEIVFPRPPVVDEKRTSHPKAEIIEERARVEKDKQVWAAVRVTYSIPIPKDRIDAAYDGGKRGMLKARPGEIVSDEKTEIAGTQGRRYLVSYNKGKRLADHLPWPEQSRQRVGADLSAMTMRQPVPAPRPERTTAAARVAG